MLRIEDGIRLKRLSGFDFSGLRIRSRAPCVVAGSPETCVEDIRFSDARIQVYADGRFPCVVAKTWPFQASRWIIAPH